MPDPIDVNRMRRRHGDQVIQTTNDDGEEATVTVHELGDAADDSVSDHNPLPPR